MNTPPPSRPAPLHVPVLTEVVELDDVVPQATALPDQAPAFASVPVVPVNPLASPGTATPSPSLSVTSPTSAPQQTPEAPPSIAPFAQPMPFAPMAPATSSPAVPPPLRAAPVAAVPLAAPVAAPRPAPAGLSFDEAQMTQRVLVEVQRQIDGMLEYRLREALAPILARTSEALVRELRQELSKTMRDVVSRAVAQEVVRQRSR